MNGYIFWIPLFILAAFLLGVITGTYATLTRVKRWLAMRYTQELRPDTRDAIAYVLKELTDNDIL